MADYLREKTTEQLIYMYAWEYNRLNRRDRELAHKAIKKELRRRFNTMMNLLDDWQTDANPRGTYDRLIKG